ncbi:hypothetical protein WMY93_032641 [Mugilogobius chulae]|uniref:ApaG domain-containing protein n=1 Tax=Mugilogobius chulae TaxID=88201 RepID=A0AAW0MVU0_9GOBI
MGSMSLSNHYRSEVLLDVETAAGGFQTRAGMKLCLPLTFCFHTGLSQEREKRGRRERREGEREERRRGERERRTVHGPGGGRGEEERRAVLPCPVERERERGRRERRGREREERERERERGEERGGERTVHGPGEEEGRKRGELFYPCPVRERGRGRGGRERGEKRDRGRERREGERERGGEEGEEEGRAVLPCPVREREENQRASDPSAIDMFITGSSFSSWFTSYVQNVVTGEFPIIRDQIFRYVHEKGCVATTDDITVSVSTSFLPELSSVHPPHYFFTYRIRIEMSPLAPASAACQLDSRYWKITTSDGNVEEVQGPGVVGEFPVMTPGKVHEYASCTTFSTSSEHMEGHYTFHRLANKEEVFQVVIPRFHMECPPFRRPSTKQKQSGSSRERQEEEEEEEEEEDEDLNGSAASWWPNI